MLFKNLTLFRYNPSWKPELQNLEEALEKNRFTPCSATQAQSIGWVEPRGIDNGALVEFVNGQWLLRLLIEDKPVPTAVIKRHVEEACNKIEQESGRRPGRKHQVELKEEVLLDLLPKAFPRQRGVNIWINPKNHWVMMDATATSATELATTALVESIQGLSIKNIQTEISPSVAMADWLLGEEPASWTIDRDCELRAESAEFKSTLRYSGLPLNTPEIHAHIEQGMFPTQLALTWNDRVSVVLTHELKIKRIGFLDVVFESNPNDADDMFDADAAIATGELLPLVESMLHLLGGEQQAA